MYAYVYIIHQKNSDEDEVIYLKPHELVCAEILARQPAEAAALAEPGQARQTQFNILEFGDREHAPDLFIENPLITSCYG